MPSQQYHGDSRDYASQLFNSIGEPPTTKRTTSTPPPTHDPFARPSTTTAGEHSVWLEPDKG